MTSCQRNIAPIAVSIYMTGAPFEPFAGGGLISASEAPNLAASSSFIAVLVLARAAPLVERAVTVPVLTTVTSAVRALRAAVV